MQILINLEGINQNLFKTEVTGTTSLQKCCRQRADTGSSVEQMALSLGVSSEQTRHKLSHGGWRKELSQL